jgi:hypothetical protein
VLASDRAVTVLVCGAGSVGQRHIGNRKSRGAAVEAWRQHKHLAEALAGELGILVPGGRIERRDAVVVAITRTSISSWRSGWPELGSIFWSKSRCHIHSAGLQNCTVSPRSGGRGRVHAACKSEARLAQAADRLDTTSLLRVAKTGTKLQGVPCSDPWAEVDTPADLRLYQTDGQLAFVSLGQWN